MRLSSILSAAVSFLLYNCAESTTINKLTGVAEEDTRRLRSVDFTKSSTDKGEERSPGLAHELQQSLGEGPLKESIARISQEEAMKPLREQFHEEVQRKKSIARMRQEKAKEMSREQSLEEGQRKKGIARISQKEAGDVEFLPKVQPRDIIAGMTQKEAQEMLRQVLKVRRFSIAEKNVLGQFVVRFYPHFQRNGLTPRDVEALLVKCGFNEYTSEAIAHSYKLAFY